KLALAKDRRVLGPDRVTASTVAGRERRARERADRVIGECIGRFAEKDVFPDGGEDALFALLVQLPDWAAELSIRSHNENDEVLAVFLKGSDARAVQGSIVLMQNADAYVVPDGVPVSNDVPLLQWGFSQLQAGSSVGLAWNGAGRHSYDGRPVTLVHSSPG
ncbi:hypothetical protein EWW49_30275, partial [Pseudomonas syringae]